jgi:hypothetical protein
MIVIRRLEILDTTKDIDLVETSRGIGNDLMNAIIIVTEIVTTTDATLESKVDIVNDRLVLRHDNLTLLPEGIMKTKWQLIQCMLAW